MSQTLVTISLTFDTDDRIMVGGVMHPTVKAAMESGAVSVSIGVQEYEPDEEPVE